MMTFLHILQFWPLIVALGVMAVIARNWRKP